MHNGFVVKSKAASLRHARVSLCIAQAFCRVCRIWIAAHMPHFVRHYLCTRGTSLPVALRLDLCSKGTRRRLGLLGGEQASYPVKPHAGFSLYFPAPGGSFVVFLQGEINDAAAPLWESHKPHRSRCHVENNRRFVGFVFFANRDDVQNVGWKHVCRANSACGEHCADVDAASSVSHVAHTVTVACST